MKKLLLGLGSFVAAAAPVAAVVACGSSNSNTTSAGVDNGGNTGGTDGKPSGGDSHHVTTTTDLHAELVKITSIDLTSSASLKDMKAGVLLTLVKTKMNEEITKNTVLSDNHTEMARLGDVKFKLDGSKVMFQWQAQGDLNPLGFYETEIKGLDLTGLTTTGQQIMLTVQSSKTVNLINHAKTTVADSVDSVYVSSVSIADSTGQDDLFSSNGKWMSFASGTPDPVTIPTGTTIIDYVIRTYVPLLTDATSAKLLYEVVAAETTVNDISLKPMTW